MQKINQLFQRKSVIVTLCIIVIIGGFIAYKAATGKAAPERYVTAAVEKGTLVVSVSGSGQVSASNQVDVKPKVSGDLTSVPVTAGQEVRAGSLLATLDSGDAQKTVRDARISLDSARLAMQKLRQPADALSLTQAQNSLDQTRESKTNAETNLDKTYDDGFNTVANAFWDLPTVMSGMQDLLYANTLNYNQANIYFFGDAVKAYNNKVLEYRDDADASFAAARKKYDQNFADYKTSSRYSDTSALETLINETYDTTKSIAEAVKDANNLINFYQDRLTERNIKAPATVATYLSSLSSYTSKTNTHLSNLLSIQNSITSSRNAITNADRSITEKTQSFAKLQAGADPLDIKSQELTLRQRENALADAQAKLSDYVVRAPFDGVVAKVSARLGDAASSATVIATLVTKQKIAEISLNEVDAAKVKAGQKVTLTFDAVPELEITGQVADIDSLGTVTSGVVTYNVKIVFDTQDDRVKPGMSVTASIITDAKTDVLMVPNSAVKTSGTQSYVLLFDQAPAGASSSSQGVVSPTPPRNQQVTVGLSNDSMTEILSGLAEGDTVVTRTVTGTTTATPTTGTGIPGLGGSVRTGGSGGVNFRPPGD